MRERLYWRHHTGMRPARLRYSRRSWHRCARACASYPHPSPEARAKGRARACEGEAERRRRMVETVRCRLGHDRVSQRRACRALSQPRSTQRYRPRRPDADRRLIEELRRLVGAYPRYGSERVHELLVGTLWRVNFKRVHRLWKQEHLQVPRRQRKRRRLPGNSENGCIRHKATHRNHV